MPVSPSTPLTLGGVRVWTPVILAPMAGITDVAMRRLCREFAEAALPTSTRQRLSDAVPHADAPGGLFVCEMIAARALVEGNDKTWRMVEPDPDERVRSIQLYGTDAASTATATRMLVDRGIVDHLDLNFGCPVPKVTSNGGGSALPWKLDLFREVTRAAVRAAGDIPVTVKIRIGIDADHRTDLDAARIAQDVGCQAVTLHARTLTQYYSGEAHWDAITALREELDIPVFGNGDVFSGDDARAMLARTGCAAVEIGRGAQGRPWIFFDVVRAITGDPEPSRWARPPLGVVREVILRHAQLMVDYCGDEHHGMRGMRKHIRSYLRGFRVGGERHLALGRVSSLDELRELLNDLDGDAPYPDAALGRRGRGGHERRARLPQGWLDSRTVSDSDRHRLLTHDTCGDGG